jgi:hypothetical protein
MATKMDLVATKFDYHRWMANKMDSVVAIKFGCHSQMETKSKEYDKPLLACFSRAQGWATFKILVTIEPSQFLKW